MKKAGFIVAVVLFLASCKKDYTCTCTVPASGSQPEATYIYQLDDKKKKDAKAACRAAEDIWALAGGTCEIKK